jgi:hypothetical protein
MNNFIKLAIASMLVMTNIHANPAKGQKLYLKKLKKSCNMNGAKISSKHTQDEWLELKDSGKLEDEIKRICPEVKDVRDKYLPDLFDFFYEFGSDSGNVPSC